MGRLGLERFSVVGHDRGGRVAYRMALDHPDAVERLGVLNIVPTVDQFERMAEGASLGYWPWYFLAQPPPFAERVIAASAEYVVRDILASWTARPDAISPEAADHYVEAFTAETIPGMCADYRASFHIDRQMDAEDRDAGRRIVLPGARPLGRGGGALSDSLEVWRRLGRARRGQAAALRPLHPGGGARGAHGLAARFPGLNASDAALIGSAATDGRFQVLLVIGRVSCEPERREELIGLLRRMQEDSRREEGCLRYGFFAAVEDENSYIAVEEWTDREALDRHFAEPHLHEFSARLLELVSQRPEVAIHEVAGTSSFPDRPA